MDDKTYLCYKHIYDMNHYSNLFIFIPYINRYTISDIM